MAFSYSFHLSNRKHSVSTTAKVQQADKHNLRKFGPEQHDIVQLRGKEQSILEDVKRIYREEFDECLERYNANKRSDRQIRDYLKHVSDSRADVAAELIIQVGDMEFWREMPKFAQHRTELFFEDQLKALERLVPEFKIASAVIHYDEASPHMHVVGVPVADGYKKGMEKQVAKTKVFTAERLSFLQDEMRKAAEVSMQQFPDIFKEKLNEKEVGRNYDLPQKSLEAFYGLQKELESMNAMKDELEAEIDNMAQQNAQLLQQAQAERESIIARAYKRAKEILEDLKAEIERLKAEIASLFQQKQEAEQELAETKQLLQQAKESAVKDRFSAAYEVAALKNQVNKYEKVLGASPDLQKHYKQVENSLKNTAAANVRELK